MDREQSQKWRRILIAVGLAALILKIGLPLTHGDRVGTGITIGLAIVVGGAFIVWAIKEP